MGAEDLTPTEGDLLDEIVRMLDMKCVCPYKAEDGWYTYAEIKERAGLTTDKVRERLRKLIEAGKMERGSWQNKYFYRVVKDEPTDI